MPITEEFKSELHIHPCLVTEPREHLHQQFVAIQCEIVVLLTLNLKHEENLSLN